MIKTVDDYVKIFKDMSSEKEVYELHIQVGEHAAVHLHSEDTGFNVQMYVMNTTAAGVMVTGSQS